MKRLFLLMFGAMLVFEVGRLVQATPASSASLDFARQSMTVHVGAVYGHGPSCTYARASFPVYEDVHGCILGSFSTGRRPVSLDYMWRGSTTPWFSGNAGVPKSLMPTGLASIHLEWRSGRVYLFMLAGEHLTGVDDIQFEAVTPAT